MSGQSNSQASAPRSQSAGRSGCGAGASSPRALAGGEAPTIAAGQTGPDPRSGLQKLARAAGHGGCTGGDGADRASGAIVPTGLDGEVPPREFVRSTDGSIRCALIWCPEVPEGTRFILNMRSEDGSVQNLEQGITQHSAPSLNLARLRQRGAQLGANEVVLILP